MPIYEYECQACKHTHEVIQRMNDPPLAKCPDCGAGNLEKLFSAAAIIVREITPQPSRRSQEQGSLAFDAVPDDFRHPRLGAATGFLPE
jgi:putative FmdB family regulatory protein